MSAYYNEIDPFAVLWLRELIRVGAIADGVVDDRSIIDVEATDLVGFTQCHFFAGIGGWSYALRLARWPDDRPVWTGSAPCQPFSTAGNQKGKDDDRHLAPHWLNLIKECRPPVIYGEQVAAAIRHGWLDDLQDALGGEGYTTGEVVLPACGLNAPHIRQRLWFYAALDRMANSTSDRRDGSLRNNERESLSKVVGRSSDDGMVNSKCPRREQGTSHRGVEREFSTGVEAGRKDTERQDQHGHAGCGGATSRTAESNSNGCDTGSKTASPTRHGHSSESESGADRHGSANAPLLQWDSPDWLFCRDGKWRPVESGTFPLVDGLPKHMGRGSGLGVEIDMHPSEARAVRLKGYGNAIVPQVAAEVINAFMEYLECQI